MPYADTPRAAARSVRAASPKTAPFDGIRTFLRVLDAFLTAIETTVWDLRHTIEELSTSTSRGLADAKSGVADATARLARLTATGATLSIVATTYRLHVTKAAFLPRSMAARHLDRLHEKNAVRLREAAETHGGAFLKVGQLLSARPDVLPKPYVDELSVLQDAAPRVPYDTIRLAIEGEIGSLADTFARFDVEPIAAASIGQVHRATLHDGSDVAVKVQRPGIRSLVDQDLALLEIFLEALAPMFPPTDHATIAREIRASVMRELDFGGEAADSIVIARFLEGSEGVIVPAVLAELTTARLLVTRFVEGKKITDVLDELAAAIEAGDSSACERRDRILGTLLETYVRQVLEAGHFHADPHPGNILVTPNDDVVLLDFGCTRAMSDETRRHYLALVSSFVVNDVEGLVRSLDVLGFRTRSGKPETLLEFANALLGSFARATGEARFPSREELAEEARGMFAAAERDPVTVLPSEFVMIARVFGTLAGLFVHYRPSIDVTTRVLPVVARALAS